MAGLGERFTGKVALVTGAASGIGRAVSLRLASEGANVLAFDLNAAGLAETAALAAGSSGSIVTRSGDVSQRQECIDAVADCVGRFGKLDILGNVAGVGGAQHFTDVTEELYRKFMGVNVDGYFWMAQAAIPHLLASSGNIVNLGSISGLTGQAYNVAYCTTKGAVINLTRALAAEYVKTPLRVNAICPGGVLTGLTANFSIPADIDGELMFLYSGFRGMVDPTEIANLFAFLASDEAKNIHGALVPTDGGITAS